VSKRGDQHTENSNEDGKEEGILGTVITQTLAEVDLEDKVAIREVMNLSCAEISEEVRNPNGTAVTQEGKVVEDAGMAKSQSTHKEGMKPAMPVIIKEACLGKVAEAHNSQQGKTEGEATHLDQAQTMQNDEQNLGPSMRDTNSQMKATTGQLGVSFVPRRGEVQPESMQVKLPEWRSRVRPRSPNEMLNALLLDNENWREGKEARAQLLHEPPKRFKHAQRNWNAGGYRLQRKPRSQWNSQGSLAACAMQPVGQRMSTPTREEHQGYIQQQGGERITQIEARPSQEQQQEVMVTSTRQPVTRAGVEAAARRPALQPILVNSQPWRQKSMSTSIKVAARNPLVCGPRQTQPFA
jgi:hypothetical protein